MNRLLLHLERAGFSGAPRYLGNDEQGRDKLSYLPGDVPAKFRRFSDDQVARAAQLLRKFHDATRNTELTGDFPVVCHHDAGPNNFVFLNGLPVALIDFDLTSPGDPLEDIGYMAWLWCVSSKPDRQPASDQAAQVRLLIDAYGLDHDSRVKVFDAMLERQDWNIKFWQQYLSNPDPSVAGIEQIKERIAWTGREQAYLSAQRAQFINILMLN